MNARACTNSRVITRRIIIAHTRNIAIFYYLNQSPLYLHIDYIYSENTRILYTLLLIYISKYYLRLFAVRFLIYFRSLGCNDLS